MVSDVDVEWLRAQLGREQVVHLMSRSKLVVRAVFGGDLHLTRREVDSTLDAPVTEGGRVVNENDPIAL